MGLLDSRGLLGMLQGSIDETLLALAGCRTLPSGEAMTLAHMDKQESSTKKKRD